jgi:hypothetical protein
MHPAPQVGVLSALPLVYNVRICGTDLYVPESMYDVCVSEHTKARLLFSSTCLAHARLPSFTCAQDVHLTLHILCCTGPYSPTYTSEYLTIVIVQQATPLCCMFAKWACMHHSNMTAHMHAVCSHTNELVTHMKCGNYLCARRNWSFAAQLTLHILCCTGPYSPTYSSEYPSDGFHHSVCMCMLSKHLPRLKCAGCHFGFQGRHACRDNISHICVDTGVH